MSIDTDQSSPASELPFNLRSFWNSLACEGRHRPYNGLSYIKHDAISDSRLRYSKATDTALSEFEKRGMIKRTRDGVYAINPKFCVYKPRDVPLMRAIWDGIA